MRPRKEIVDDANMQVDCLKNMSVKDLQKHNLAMLQLEVLLDIRDLLDTRPAVKHPESAPPPGVKV